jgi:predicted O-methyltransferase YrrM
MSHDEQRGLTSADVLDRIRAETEAPVNAPTGSADTAGMERIQAMQRDFRAKPLGGKLLPIKKIFHWFVASAFDRQAKVIESLLTVVDDLSIEVQRLSRSVSHMENELSGTRRSEITSGSSVDPTHSEWVATDDPSLVASMAAILNVCAEMMEPERVLLYSLVFALKPSFCLEIGTFRGGSSSIICRAMDDNGRGRLVCVDPELRIPDGVWASIRHRVTLIQGASPEALAEARKVVPSRFDLALIDGDHRYEGALSDIEGVLEHLEDGAYIVLHDCHFFDVRDAIREALRRHPDALVDCGVVSVTENPQVGEDSIVDGKQVVWGGLYLLRVTHFNPD